MRLLAAAAGLVMLCAGSLSASAASIPAAPVGATTAQERLVTPVHARERHHRRWHRHYHRHDGWDYRRWYRHNEWRHHRHHHHRHHHHRRHHHH